MIKPFTFQALPAVILALTIGTVNAQQEFTLYHMPVLSQATYLNPAAVPEHKLSLSLPLPSLFVGFNNSALNVKSFMDKDGRVDYQGFVDRLREEKNYLGIGANAELLHVRFKASDNFISVFSRLVSDFRFLYPKDLFGIGAEGIKNGYDLSGIGVHYNNYLEYGVGFTRAQPDSKWTYGGRLKMLGGIANIQTKKSDVAIRVDRENINRYTLDADLEVNVGAGVDGGEVKDIDELFDLDTDELEDVIKLNRGLAMDAGATLQYNKRLSFGAALNNLGFINWKSYSENYTNNLSLSFDGVILEDIDFSEDLGSLINDQLDSVFSSYEEVFEESTDTTRSAYRTWLPTTLFLSAHYQLTPRLRASGTLYTEFFKGISPGLIAGINYAAGRNIDLTATWWWFKKSAANLGVGMVFKPGPVQFYLVMDNILPASFVEVSDSEKDIDQVTLPYHMKNFNLRVGMNLVFGRIKDESRLPKPGLNRKKHGGRKYLYKPSLK